ncbi:MAG: phosphoribosylglycinamide formyltransferase [Phaeodactylibacter sp.]|nr:phosphoribosylglycinamide formyltransferase [Phaeodactylibacter sp.]MCB9275780.1 phosphoribosylglycinamide formyltransferase [Lewinellaceae bacterium]
MSNLAIFASGTGSNAAKIIEYFREEPNIRVRLVVSNKATAPVLGLAERNGIESMVISRAGFYETETLLQELGARNIDFIVLAGFLWLIPPYLVRAFAGRLVNIHPALLPKYGGKGMYGMNVHRAVKAAGEKETGITIHYVNERYDEGDAIFQARCTIDAGDSPEDIAHKVQVLEHEHFAPVIERLVSSGQQNEPSNH